MENVHPERHREQSQRYLVHMSPVFTLVVQSLLEHIDNFYKILSRQRV